MIRAQDKRRKDNASYEWTVLEAGGSPFRKKSKSETATSLSAVKYRSTLMRAKEGRVSRLSFKSADRIPGQQATKPRKHGARQGSRVL